MIWLRWKDAWLHHFDEHIIEESEYAQNYKHCIDAEIFQHLHYLHIFNQVFNAFDELLYQISSNLHAMATSTARTSLFTFIFAAAGIIDLIIFLIAFLTMTMIKDTLKDTCLTM